MRRIDEFSLPCSRRASRERTAVAGPISNRAAAACRRDIPPSIAFMTFLRISIDSAMISSRPLVALKPNDRYS
jgi:hypothetical protein